MRDGGWREKTGESREKCVFNCIKLNLMVDKMAGNMNALWKLRIRCIYSVELRCSFTACICNLYYATSPDLKYFCQTAKITIPVGDIKKKNSRESEHWGLLRVTIDCFCGRTASNLRICLNLLLLFSSFSAERFTMGAYRNDSLFISCSQFFLFYFPPLSREGGLWVHEDFQSWCGMKKWNVN